MPAWDEITPSTERSIGARRLTITNVLLGLNVAGFFLTVLSLVLKLPAVAAATSFSMELAIDRMWLWQIVTYTFTQSIEPLVNLFPFLLCCYLLHEKGGELEKDLGPRGYLAVYLGASLYGAVAHAAAQATFHQTPPALGCFGPVMAVMLVHAMRSPERVTLFLLLVPMRARAVAFLSAALLLLYSWILYRAGFASIVGSIVFAFTVTWLNPRLDGMLDSIASKRERAKFIEEVEVKREVDRILDKISRTGIDSLTVAEQRLLKRASRIMQDGKGPEHE